MQKRKDIVLKILYEKDLTKSHLARKLDMTRANLNYHLLKDDIDFDLFIKILGILGKTLSDVNYTSGEIEVGKVNEPKENYISLEDRISKLEREIINLKAENHDYKQLLTLLLQENISLEMRSQILAALNIQMDSIKKDVTGNSS